MVTGKSRMYIVGIFTVILLNRSWCPSYAFSFIAWLFLHEAAIQQRRSHVWNLHMILWCEPRQTWTRNSMKHWLVSHVVVTPWSVQSWKWGCFMLTVLVQVKHKWHTIKICFISQSILASLRCPSFFDVNCTCTCINIYIHLSPY